MQAPLRNTARSVHLQHFPATAPVRVIAGKYRSRRLSSIRGVDLRPTSDRLRETLFNVLTAGNPDALQSSSWLDLYAGTGAVGIEALSRGAAKVIFVEQSRAAAELIRRNLSALEIKEGFRLLTVSSATAVERGKGTFNYVFLDPPYRMQDEYKAILKLLGRSQLVDSATLIIAEHSSKFDPGSEHGNLQRYRKLELGDAALSFYCLKVA